MNMQLVPMFRIPSPMDCGSNFLPVLRIPYLLEKGGGIPGPIPLRERGRDLSSRQTNNEGPRIQRSGMEEFLDDIYKLKRIHSYALPWKLRNLPLVKR